MKQYKIKMICINYTVHWTNLVLDFFFLQSSIPSWSVLCIFVYQSSELFKFFTVPNHCSGTVHNLYIQLFGRPSRCRCLPRRRSYCRSRSHRRCRRLVACSLAVCSSSLPKSSFSVHAVSWSSFGCSCSMLSCSMSGRGACIGCSGRGRKFVSTQSQ